MAAPHNLGNLGARNAFKWTFPQRNSLASTKLINQTDNDVTNNDIIYQQQEEAVQILAFQDEGAEEVVEAVEINTSIPGAVVSTASREGRTHSIRDFLGRVYQIDEFDWVLADTNDKVLKTYRFPDTLLSKLPIANKVNNFLGLRAGVMFTVLVNKQQFQAGNLLISYLPHAKYNANKAYLHAQPYGVVSRTGTTRANLDLMDATRASLTVPYASPYVYYNLLTGEGTIGDFTISVYSALRDVSGSGRVGVRVLASFVDVDLQFPTGQSARIPSKYFGLFEKVKDINFGKVKDRLEKLKEIKTEVEGLVRDFKTLTNHSNDVSITSFKQKALPNMACANGQNETHMLALDNNTALTPMNMGHISFSEMRFSDILKIPTFYRRISLKNNAIAGTNLWKATVTPMESTTIQNLPPDTVAPDYLMFLAQNFKQWRGPIIYHFRAIKTTFHSVRLRVGWSPVSTINAAIDRNACYSKIVDLKDRNEFTLEVPYVYPRPWLGTREVRRNYCGVIFLDVEVQMVNPETVSDTIDIIIERSAGEGFQLSIPSSLQYYPIDPRLTKPIVVPVPPPAKPADAAVALPVTQVEPPKTEVVQPNPYDDPTTAEGQYSSISDVPVIKTSLAYFKSLDKNFKDAIRALIKAGKAPHLPLLTLLNDMASSGMSVDSSYLSMPFDELNTMYENTSEEMKDSYKRATLGDGVEYFMRRKRSIRDMSTLTNHSAAFPGCEKKEQDLDRETEIDETFVRPDPALQADQFTLGSTVDSVKQMIMRSTRVNIIGVPSETMPLHIQPHALAPMAYVDNAYIRPAMDNLSYYASLYTFARGGVGVRLVTDKDPYVVLFDGSLFLNRRDTDKAAPFQTAPRAISDLDIRTSTNYIVQAINPGVEGFGEFNVPFYSDTYCMGIDMQPSSSVSVDYENLNQPNTHMVVIPYPGDTGTTAWTAYRHASHDYEFSMLTGPPLFVTVYASDT